MTTSKRVASKAAKGLQSKGSSKSQKAVDGSDLAQAKRKGPNKKGKKK